MNRASMLIMLLPEERDFYESLGLLVGEIVCGASLNSLSGSNNPLRGLALALRGAPGILALAVGGVLGEGMNEAGKDDIAGAKFAWKISHLNQHRIIGKLNGKLTIFPGLKRAGLGKVDHGKAHYHHSFRGSRRTLPAGWL